MNVNEININFYNLYKNSQFYNLKNILNTILEIEKYQHTNKALKYRSLTPALIIKYFK